MTREELIQQYATDHADNRQMDASEIEALLAEFAGVDTWHLQEKEDIYDAVKDWCLHTFVCIMKDGTFQRFNGMLDEDCEGHIYVHIDGLDDDYDNVDDIVKWIEYGTSIGITENNLSDRR